MPPTDFLMSNSQICCGAESFDDYVVKTPENEDDTFDVPDSCCFRRNPKAPIIPGCGKGLSLEQYKDSMWFHEQIASAIESLQKAKTFDEATQILESHFGNEI